MTTPQVESASAQIKRSGRSHNRLHTQSALSSYLVLGYIDNN
jgi:hypothetical protein